MSHTNPISAYRGQTYFPRGGTNCVDHVRTSAAGVDLAVRVGRAPHSNYREGISGANSVSPIFGTQMSSERQDPRYGRDILKRNKRPNSGTAKGNEVNIYI